MTHAFVFEPDSGGVMLRLASSDSRPIPVDRWALEAPDALLGGVDLVRRIEAAGAAAVGDDAAYIDQRAIAALSPSEAASLGLPEIGDVVVRLGGRGLMTQPTYAIDIEWMTALGRPILGAERVGAFLRANGVLKRLPGALLDIALAAEAVCAAGKDEKLAAIAALRDVLPAGAETGLVSASGLIAHITIAVADAFSLDLDGEGEDARLAPILHRAQDAGGEPLLPAEQQREFAGKHFNAFSSARAVYTLGRNWYVVLQPTLRRALDEVRRVNGAPLAIRRKFLAHPRAFLREALGADVDDVVIENVYRDTAAYADRVLGLGLWAPRVVPWIKLPATDWLDRGGGEVPPGGAVGPLAGLDVGGRRLALDAAQTQALRDRVVTAMAAGEATVAEQIDGQGVHVPATETTLSALDALDAARGRAARAAPPSTAEPQQALIIATNEAAIDAEALVVPARPAPACGQPAALATPLKSHQREGLAWLQRAWIGGLRGVLLADDMGLGKTLQGLAFLAWLRQGAQSGLGPCAPFLVVAPTGLLQNWREEHDRHLLGDGLGVCTSAYGAGLAALKSRAPDGAPTLDAERLAASDWVLTTYETLRDHQLAFGKVRFAALVFDEAQKIKTPGIRLTDAAKAMNADFSVALTGTPVENRLADLWCIVDAVAPGWLGELKVFSARYERDADEERLRSLKSELERPFAGRPQLMLRRMKYDRLPDLPTAEERVLPRPMPAVQQAAYSAAIDAAKSARQPGVMLETLQRLRRISLHPCLAESMDDDDFVRASARLEAAMMALDEAARAGEKALVFVGELDMQARLAGLLQRRYRLARAPFIVNGAVSGPKRQERVNSFNVAGGGFDVMILSPQAGGVGLNLQQANHVIHLSRWWNPAVEDQCTGRALRIGQTRPVYVHLPMAICADGARSFDQNLAALLERKRALIRDALMPAGSTPETDAQALFRDTVAPAT